AGRRSARARARESPGRSATTPAVSCPVRAPPAARSRSRSSRSARYTMTFRASTRLYHDHPVTELAISLRGAVKRYGNITAVAGLDLEVRLGTCVGLLGPNGAGQSTTMRLLTAHSIADEGEMQVLGFRLPAESKMARAQCGVAPQLDNLDTTLTVAQNLLVFAHLYRIGRHERREAIERALVMAKLTDRRET